MKIQTYRDLEAWKLAIELTDKIYDITARFPKEEYGLSAAELETQLIISGRRKYLEDSILQELLGFCSSINRMLSRLYQSLEKKVA